MAWPKEVDVLTADDIHKGCFDGPNGTHCAMAWIRIIFRGKSEHLQALRKLEEVVLSRTGNRSIIAWNDSQKTTKAEIASGFNEMTSRLGYVVSNPEAKRLKGGAA